MNTQNITTKKGFISLFTVLLATVILAMGIGMSSIALKQIVLASTADDANEAFYAADSGLQCAIMHDVALGPVSAFSVGANPSLSCGAITDISISGSDNEIFLFNGGDGFEWSNGNCVRITVKKDQSLGTTEIESLGYNVGCEDIGTSPRQVERALRVRYGGF